jgi:hypothetical protein
MSAQTALFVATDAVLFALLALMARIYFYGLRLVRGILVFIGMVASGALIVFVAAMVIDDPWAWGGPAILATILLFAAFLAPSSPGTKALVPDGNASPKDAWPIDDEISPSSLSIMAPPAAVIEPPSDGPLDYRHFVLDREANMFLHKPPGVSRAMCFVAELQTVAELLPKSLDDLVNLAENHVCHMAEAHTQVIQAVA